MDITVYLPNEIGEKAKAAKLNLSGLLREAVTEELERRRIVKATLEKPQVYEVDVEDNDGRRRYTGRITGALIARDGDVTVYLTDDERVLTHNARDSSYWECDDPEEELRDQLSDGSYAEALHALGLKATVDL